MLEQSLKSELHALERGILNENGVYSPLNPEPITDRIEERTCLEYLGQGRDRYAFAVPDDAHTCNTRLILKVAHDSKSTVKNHLEQQTGEAVENTMFERDFATVYMTSEQRSWMVQRRVPNTHSQKARAELRQKFTTAGLEHTDLEPRNTGHIGQRSVVYDYPWGLSESEVREAEQTYRSNQSERSERVV